MAKEEIQSEEPETETKAGPEIDDLAGEEGGEEGRRLAAYWHGQIQEVIDDKDHKRWVKRGTTIEKRYRDERNRMGEEGSRRYNALWSNVQILEPALYGKVPIPIAERRFHDRDPAGRSASQMLERALRNEIEINGFDDAMMRATRDYLLPGRGVVWVRYEPELEEGISIPPDSDMDIHDDQGDIEPSEDPDNDGQESDEGDDEDQEIQADGETKHEDEEEKLRSTGDRILRESCPVDYIAWSDFFMFPARARVWKEVVAIGKRVFMTRDQLIRRFGKKIGKAIPLQKDDRDQRRQADTNSGHEVEMKAQVYEIWSKNDREVFWIAEGYTYLTDRKDDFMKLENFFPVPQPLFANATNNTLIPVPDYIQYQDQAIQIDELTQRISMLAKACKVAGVYNAAARAIRRLLDESVENELIPVDDWTAFAEKGGVAGNISLLPLKEIIGVINELMMIKEKCIEEMDRLTGINDIMRGTSDARETMGGVRIKSNNTGTRLQRRQNDVARMARDVVRIMADIMCQHFSAQSIIEASGALYEEGLGPDMPSMASMQNAPEPPTAPPPAPPQGQLPPPPQQLALPPPVPPPGAAASGPPGLSPPPSPGGPPSLPQGMPPGMPQAGPPGPPPPPVPTGPPPPSPEEQAIMRIVKGLKLLRNETTRGFRVDIEVDSTIYGDAAQEKGDRTEFLNTVTAYLGQSMQMGATTPEIIPLLAKFLQFGVRGFRVGRDLEVAIEEFCDQAVGIAKQAREHMQNQPNPEMIKAQGAQAKAESDKIRAQADIKSTEMQSKSDELQAQAEVQRQTLEMHGEAFNARADMEQKQADIEIQKKKVEIEHMKLQIELAKVKGAQMQARVDQQAQYHDMKLQNQTMEHEQGMQAQEMQHEQGMQASDEHAQATQRAHEFAQQARPPKVEQEGAGGL